MDTQYIPLSATPTPCTPRKSNKHVSFHKSFTCMTSADTLRTPLSSKESPMSTFDAHTPAGETVLRGDEKCLIAKYNGEDVNAIDNSIRNINNNNNSHSDSNISVLSPHGSETNCCRDISDNLNISDTNNNNDNNNIKNNNVCQNVSTTVPVDSSIDDTFGINSGENDGGNNDSDLCVLTDKKENSQEGHNFGVNPLPIVDRSKFERTLTLPIMSRKYDGDDFESTEQSRHHTKSQATLPILSRTTFFDDDYNNNSRNATSLSINLPIKNRRTYEADEFDATPRQWANGHVQHDKWDEERQIENEEWDDERRRTSSKARVRFALEHKVYGFVQEDVMTAE